MYTYVTCRISGEGVEQYDAITRIEQLRLQSVQKGQRSVQKWLFGAKATDKLEIWLLFISFSPSPSAFSFAMSALRSLRQISVSTSRALAARSVPAARFCLPALASRVSMTATRTFSVSARSLAEGSC